MRKKVALLVALLEIAAAPALYPQMSYATLGESAASVESDRKALSAVRRTTTSRNGYTVHEMRSAANTVREYLSPTGIIFAIAWNGVSPPDISALLGSYNEEYRQALRQTKHQHGRRSSQVKSERVVVERWGHMRNLQGKAYAPALIPPGVNIDEIN